MDYLNEISNGLTSVTTHRQSKTATLSLIHAGHGLKRLRHYFNLLDLFNFPMDLIFLLWKIKEIEENWTNRK